MEYFEEEEINNICLMLRCTDEQSISMALIILSNSDKALSNEHKETIASILAPGEKFLARISPSEIRRVSRNARRRVVYKYEMQDYMRKNCEIWHPKKDITEKSQKT